MFQFTNIANLACTKETVHIQFGHSFNLGGGNENRMVAEVCMDRVQAAILHNQLGQLLAMNPADELKRAAGEVKQ